MYLKLITGLNRFVDRVFEVGTLQIQTSLRPLNSGAQGLLALLSITPQIVGEVWNLTDTYVSQSHEFDDDIRVW